MATFTIASSMELAGAGVYTSPAFCVSTFYNNIWSVQYKVTGTGTLKIQYATSLDGILFVTPAAASDIVATFAASGGPGTDGMDMKAVTIPLTTWIKFILTEDGGANAVVATVYAHHI